MRSTLLTSLLSLSTLACAVSPLYPARPPATPGAPIVDPPPSKVVVHATITGTGLQQALEQALPLSGSGEYAKGRKYTWKRSGLDLRFADRRVDVRANVIGTAELPLVGTWQFPLALRVLAEPVISSDYRARLQGATVEVTSDDVRLRAAQWAGGLLEKIKQQVQAQIDPFTYDLRPLVVGAHDRIAKPIDLPLGDAKGCAWLKVAGIEAGPTVLADGLEKDFALVIEPSVSLPCAAPATPPELPPLNNVATIIPGPFTVTVPIVARYEELAKAMTLAFTDGKLYFSKDFPKLYMTNPEVYAASDQLVLKLKLAGPVDKAGIHVNLDGDIYFAGHPAVVDNELRVPDLQPTIETASFLLKLKAALDGDSIRDQARQALRLDLGDRLAAARAKLSTDLTFAAGAGNGCLKSDVSRIEVTGVNAHASYLRMYVNVTAQTGVYLPCPATVPAPSAATAATATPPAATATPAAATATSPAATGPAK